MLFRLTILFALIPLVELFILFRVGAIIGAVPTLLIIVLTAVIGAYLSKREGLKTLFRIRDSLRQGSMPAEHLVDALLILVAGLLLLTPGFLTDITGFLLLLPVTRRAFKRWIANRMKKWIGSGQFIYRRFR